jgi:hypothetical protein
MTEYLDDEPDAEQAVEELPCEPQTLSEKLSKAAPWWLISSFAHGLVAVVCMYIIAVTARVKEEEAVVVSEHRKVEQPEIVKKQKDPVKREQELPLEKKHDEPVIYKAPEEDQTETPNDEEFKKAKGESLDNISDKPFKGKSLYDVVGVSGGGGGKHGGNLGGRRLRVATSGGGGQDTEDAVLNALRWLARHQNPDGSWSAQKHTAHCGKNKFWPNGVCAPNPGAETFDVGLTGLSLLTFLGAGYTHLSKDVYDGICFGDVVKSGVKYLMRIQEPSGRITSDVPKYMYNHLIAAFALSESYGLTGSAMIKDSAQRSVDYALQAQNPGKAWRYSFKAGDNDSSVTGWGAQLFKSAELAELTVNKEAYKGVIAWYDEVTQDSYHRTGYVDARIGKVVIPGVNEHYSDHPALTAIAAMSRMFIEKNRADPHVRGGIDRCMEDLPEWDAKAVKVDFYYWYYASYAIFQFDGAAGSAWRRWNEKIKPAVIDRQNKMDKDCRNGSWEPVDRWSSEGGRVYMTAMGALILEVYYRLSGALNIYVNKGH